MSDLRWRSRAALLAASLGALAWLAGASSDQETVDTDAEPPLHTRIDLPSIAACGGCHREVYEEWSRSLHARAWTNPNARAATADFQKKSCRPCHSPLPVLVSGLERQPDLRDFNHDDGVHCLSCHGLADGVAAARTVEGAPCRPRFEPRLLQAEMCQPCHEPTHQAFAEFRTSDAFALGLRCVDCHMPPCSERPGRSHAPTGGFEEDFVRRALAWRCSLEQGRVRVELRNRTGHKFPGEIPSRSFVVRVEFPGHEPLRTLLRKPNKEEARADDRLLPDERRVLEFDVPSGATEARVTLLFLPLPLLTDEDAFVLGSWSAQIPTAATGSEDGAGR